MESKNDIQNSIDSSRLLTKLSIVGLVTSLVMLTVTLVVASLRGNAPGFDVFPLAVIPYTLAALFSVGALICGTLGHAAAQEEEEKQLLEKRRDNHALDVEEDVRFTAGRSSENYRRFAPYTLAVIAAAAVGLLLWHTHSVWTGRLTTEYSTTNPLNAAVISFIMMLASIFVGAFFVGQSRLKSFRWLRPVGAWLAAAFVVQFAATVTAVFANSNHYEIDRVVARIIFWAFAVLGIEFITNFIIEFYRPRTLKELRPVFESRLLALFTEPGGVMRNIASAMDYQFGFKVSGTWIYGFLERSFFPLIFVWALLFWSFTMIHEVGPSEVGIREELGVVTSKQPLTPGVYWTLPYPFGALKTYSCTEIRSTVIGEFRGKDGKKQISQVALWTNEHGSDDNNFIVAVKQENGRSDNETASISFVRMLIPIQYHIRPEGVMDFAYKNSNPERTLLRIGEQAATEYLASFPMMEIMSTGRAEAETAMRQRIQKLADEHELGIEIIAVSILDAHPPVENVAPAFQKVIGAMEERETMILKAQAYAARVLPESEASAAGIVAAAKDYAYKATRVSAAEGERFNAQLQTYRAMPEMFKLKAYLEVLERDCAASRKFIIASELKDEVYDLNFEVKERLDLIDTDLTKIEKK